MSQCRTNTAREGQEEQGLSSAQGGPAGCPPPPAQPVRMGQPWGQHWLASPQQSSFKDKNSTLAPAWRLLAAATAGAWGSKDPSPPPPLPARLGPGPAASRCTGLSVRITQLLLGVGSWVPCQILRTLKMDSTRSNPTDPSRTMGPGPALPDGCTPHPTRRRQSQSLHPCARHTLGQPLTGCPNCPPGHEGLILRQSMLQPGSRPAPRGAGQLRPCPAGRAPDPRLSPEPGRPFAVAGHKSANTWLFPAFVGRKKKYTRRLGACGIHGHRGRPSTRCLGVGVSGSRRPAPPGRAHA